MQAIFRFFAKLIVTHIFSDVPQLILTTFPSGFSARRPSVALLFHHILFVQFSRYNSPVSFETRSQNTISCVLRSNINWNLVGPSGLEPPTLRLSVVRSSQLSYGPVVDMDFISLAETLALQLAHSVMSPLRSQTLRWFARDLDEGLPLGGDSRDRTGDLLLARQALSQLSYIPELSRRPSSDEYPIN